LDRNWTFTLVPTRGPMNLAKQNGGTTAAAFSGASFSSSKVHRTFDSQIHMRQFSHRSCH